MQFIDTWLHWVIEVGEVVTLALLSYLVIKLLRWTKNREAEETKCCKVKK